MTSAREPDPEPPPGRRALKAAPTPQQIRRHAHPKARPETPAAAPQPTGIDYLAIIAAEHQAAQRQRINYGALAPASTPVPAAAGQRNLAPSPAGQADGAREES